MAQESKNLASHFIVKIWTMKMEKQVKVWLITFTQICPLFKRKTTVHHIKFYVLPAWLRWAPTLCTSRMDGSSTSTTMQMMLKGEINDFHFKCKCKWCWRMISEILKSNVNFPFQLCSWGCVRWHRSFPWGLSDFMKTDIKVGSCTIMGTIDNLIIRLLDTTDTMEELDTPPLLDRFNWLQLLLIVGET